MSELWQAMGAIGTFLGGVGLGSVIGVFFQIRHNKKADRTRFEDMLCQEYRQILSGIPYDALINKDIGLDPKKDKDREILNCFYRYFDLCNEQIFMRKCERVEQRTWEDWNEGICDNLKLVAFRKAWEEIEPSLAGNENEFCVFSGLRLLIGEGFRKDPTKLDYGQCGQKPCKPSNCGKLP